MLMSQDSPTKKKQTKPKNAKKTQNKVGNSEVGIKL